MPCRPGSGPAEAAGRRRRRRRRVVKRRYSAGMMDPKFAASPAVPPSSSTAEASSATAGLYDVLYRRRDVRAEFTGAPVAAEVLVRVLQAGHAAPSVGLTQPWDFVVVTDPALRYRFWEHVQGERQVFADQLHGDQAERFAGIRIDGIRQASVSLVVTYDPDRGAPAVLGRHAIADAGLYSTCLAIENLWLACTAEGWGLGWVSFYREQFLRQLIGIPDAVRPVAWLCVGPVHQLQEIPDLERHGWRQRSPLADVVHLDRWEIRAGSDVFPAGGQLGGSPVPAPEH